MEGERTIIIGGGIIGVLSAFMLKYKYPASSVLLLEKRSQVGLDWSFQNGGVLVGNATWKSTQCSPSALWSLLKSSFQSDPSVMINFRTFLQPTFWLFGLRWLYNWRWNKSKQTNRILSDFQQHSIDLHEAIRDSLKEKYPYITEYQDEGVRSIDFIDNSASVEKFFQTSDDWAEHSGISTIKKIRTRDELAKLDPALRRLKSNFAAGLVNMQLPSHNQNSHLMTRMYAKVCKAMGVQFIYDAEVSGFQVEPGSKGKRVRRVVLTDDRVFEAEKFVIASGIDSYNICKILGWRPPLWPVKGYTVNVKFSENFQPKYAMHLVTNESLFLTPIGDQYRVTKYNVISPWDDTEINETCIQKTVEAVKKKYSEEIIDQNSGWAGRRPVSADDLPIIGRIDPYENLYINTGQGQRGWVIAFASADTLADLLNNQMPVLPAGDVDPNRFWFQIKNALFANKISGVYYYYKMESIRVIMRFRGGERGAEEDFAPYIITDKSIKLPPKDHEYSYDAVVGSAQSQKDTYDIGAKQMIKDFMDGFNATIFCYGQSGSGKTFSMLGPEDVTEVLVNGIDVVPEETQEMYGIIPRATFDIFDYMNEGIKVSTQFNIKVSYIEIYNEAINDILCNPTNTNLNLREFPNLGMCVVGMVERTITEEAGVFECLSLGTANRIVCATGQNARSSRSHTVFIILVEQKLVDGSTKISKLNLVDLAGSEKIAKTGATGQSLKEAQKINLSLTTLGRCIKALTSDAKHIPFRESKLTLILKESLGGNAKTCLLVTASRKKVHKEETVGTMQFAERAKQIKSKAKQNAKKSPEELERLVAELQREVATLKRKLTESGGVIDIADMPAAGEGEEGELSTVADSEEGDVSLDTSAAYTELKVSFENYKEHSEREMLELQAALEQAKDSTNTIDHVAHREEIDMHIDRVKEVERQLSVSQKDKEMIRVDLESQLEDAQNKEKELTGNLDRTKTLKDKLEQNLEEAQSRLIQKDEELENLRDTSASSKSEIANLLAQIEELKKRIAELTESENALKITVSAQHEEIKALKQRIADLEKQLRDKESDLKTISQKLEDAMARETEFQAEIEAQKKAKHAINQLMQDKDQQLQELEKSHEETVAAAAEAKHQASQRESYLTTKIMSTETEIASMKQMLKENATTQEMLAAQEKQSQEIKTEYEKTLARERQESATAADALKSELETLKTAKNAEIQEARQELEVAKAGADVTKDKLDTATNQLSTTKSELLDLKNTDEKKKSKIDSLSNQVLQLSQDFVTKSDELKKVTDELDSMKKIENEKAAQNQVSAEEYEKEIKERDQKIADLKKRINSQQGAIKSKDQTLDKIEENMRYETSKYTEDIKLKNSTVNEQRKSIGNLEGQLSDLRTKLTNITSELRDEKRRTDSARKQSIANLHSENFGRRKTIVRSQPQIAASINQAQSGSKFNPFGVTLKKTSYGHQEQAVQEAKRASQLGASSEFKVYYGADLIKALYSNDSDEEQQAMVRRQSTGPIAEDNEDSANSSDSYSDSEPLEEAKVAADS